MTKSDGIGVDFLRTELQTGLTFARVALSARPNDIDKIQRDTKNAREAYDSFLKFRERVSLSEDEKQEITEQAEKLKDALRKLGQSL